MAAITTLREEILTNDSKNKMFLAILESFPLSKFLTEIICSLLHYPLPMNNMQPDSIVGDLTLLAAMTVVSPIIIGGASAIFLRMPEGLDIDGRERYMSTFGYRVKEILLSVILTPICVFLTAKAIGMLSSALQAKLPWFAAFLIEILVLAIVILVSSLYSSQRFNFKFGFALRHNLIDGFLSELLKILVMNALCIAAALALINGQLGTAVTFLVTMFIILAGIELMLGIVKQN